MKKKWEHLWLYYKWYLIGGAAALLLLVNFWVQKRQTPSPDYSLSIVTGSVVSEEARDKMAAQLETVLDDRNGDGKVVVTVNLYRYNGRPQEAEDTSAFMAAAVQLAADLQEKISLCYITDSEELLNADGALVRLGGAEQSVLSGETELHGFSLLCYGENEDIASQIMTKYHQKEGE